MKSTLSILLAIFACSSNFAAAEPTNQTSSQSTPSGEALMSRSVFESRFGKPIWTEGDFAKKFFSIYGVELTNFLAQPAQHAKEMINLSGVTPAAELSEASYHVVVPRIFVDSVPSNTLASMMGLQPGDEILEAYRESKGPQGGDSPWEWGRDLPEGHGRFEGSRLKLPIGDISLWNMDLLHNGDSSGYRLVVKTKRVLLSIEEADVVHYVNAIMSKCGFGEPEFFLNGQLFDPKKETQAKNQNPVELINRKYTPFKTFFAMWLPECKNLGAKFRTEFEVKTGLSKEQYDEVLRRLTRRWENGVQMGYSESVGGVEVVDALNFASLQGEIQNFADGKDVLYGGLLSQIKLVKNLRPNATFSVYRDNGIDALAFFENDSLLFCIEYLLGSGNSFLTPSLPSSISSASFIECVAKFNGLKEKPQRAIDPNGVSFAPRKLSFCPVFLGNTLFYRDTAENGEQSWKSVNLYNLPNRDALIFMAYHSLFTNSFAFVNREAPVFAQNNRLLSETNFTQLEGEAATKWSGNTNFPDTVMSWPVPLASPTFENDRNIFYIGKNYAGQFVVPTRGGYIQLFGKRDFLLAELLDVTAAKLRAEANEQAMWDRYRNMLGGEETSAGRIRDPEQRMENARKLLNYLNNGQ